ncbi:MAG: hypothetical protein WC155_02280 [Candidatus Cloacimonadales bacterium]
MSKIITESGMDFGPFDEDYLYEIERSDLVERLNIKKVEFIVYYNKALMFLEAKSSSPQSKLNPINEQTNFDDYIDEVTRKFANSINLFFSIRLGRYKDKMGIKLNKITLSQANMKLILVIKNHKEEWLPPVSDALKIKLYGLIRSCNINPCNILIINSAIAKEKGLIKD